MSFLSYGSKILSKIKNFKEHGKYDDFSIAEKFRKQGAVIGKNCQFQIRQIGSEPFLIEIGDNVHINNKVMLFTHDGASGLFRREIPYLQYFGKIVIESNCFIGYGAMIMQGTTIGHDSIVGAGAVVINDVKPGSVMIGNPAMRVSTIDAYKERCISEAELQGLSDFKQLFDKGISYSQAETILHSDSFRKKLKQKLLTKNKSKFFTPTLKKEAQNNA